MGKFVISAIFRVFSTMKIVKFSTRQKRSKMDVFIEGARPLLGVCDHSLFARTRVSISTSTSGLVVVPAEALIARRLWVDGCGSRTLGTQIWLRAAPACTRACFRGFPWRWLALLWLPHPAGLTLPPPGPLIKRLKRGDRWTEVSRHRSRIDPLRVIHQCVRAPV